MIFSENFDRSLWFILASDSYNREDIARMIKNIPEDLLEGVSNQLKMYEQHETFDCSYKTMSKLILNSEGKQTFYMIQMNPKEINIRMNGENLGIDEIIDLTLVPIQKKDIYNVNENGPRYLGSYEYENVYLTDLDLKNSEREYFIVSDTLFGLKMLNGENDLFFRFVSKKRIPNEINISDLDSRQNIKRLVRKRKNK